MKQRRLRPVKQVVDKPVMPARPISTDDAGRNGVVAKDVGILLAQGAGAGSWVDRQPEPVFDSQRELPWRNLETQSWRWNHVEKGASSLLSNRIEDDFETFIHWHSF